MWRVYVRAEDCGKTRKIKPGPQQEARGSGRLRDLRAATQQECGELPPGPRGCAYLSPSSTREHTTVLSPVTPKRWLDKELRASSAHPSPRELWAVLGANAQGRRLGTESWPGQQSPPVSPTTWEARAGEAAHSCVQKRPRAWDLVPLLSPCSTWARSAGGHPGARPLLRGRCSTCCAQGSSRRPPEGLGSCPRKVSF